MKVLAEGGTVGILSDHNSSFGRRAFFVPFFGIPASTTSGLARIALRTDAAVVPGFLSWERGRKQYRLRSSSLRSSSPAAGDDEADVIENTARFTCVIEKYVRANPGQWLWVHKRWKTRPAGEKPIYSF